LSCMNTLQVRVQKSQKYGKPHPQTNQKKHEGG